MSEIIPADRRDFHCVHCTGRILIPLDLPPTTGPCPHCGETITSPAADLPQPQPSFQIPLAVAAPTPPPEEAPVSAPTESRPAPPTEQIPATPHPLASEEAPKIVLPHHEHVSEHNIPKKKVAHKENARRRALIPVMLVLLVLSLAGGGIFYFLSKDREPLLLPPLVKAKTPTAEDLEANYIRSGWQKEAYALLENYLAAADPQRKLPFILNGSSLAPRVEEFYGGGEISDSDTPASAFSVYELSEEDRKRGLFMMFYDQPAQFEIAEFFRPLASLEVQYGLDEADLLLGALGKAGNFEMQPLKVHAFFKRTEEGLKLDWEIFTQTKYRKLQNFVNLPEVGQSGIFRVFIVEDVPDKGNTTTGTRTYRMADPAHTGDTVRVNVRVDTEVGRALSLINWRGTKESRPITRTATVELKWTGEVDSPELEISRFVCWEFLGLGGQQTESTASTQ